ncbi:hypothetical protein CTAYLR_008081 [Chrysophaeum taylorii]|uniref:Ankyrin repeat domain-containing protein n=1 Tax=Chrysophaeum taylorii TaxID=2483200 RepID=A0AAD7UKN1_9STRA|nr:hypothetical protein CTAYLR_008081 [Chrysophaeum taylorii]
MGMRSVVFVVLLVVTTGEELFEAVRADDVDRIKAALKAGAEIDAKSPKFGDQTPLMHATLQGKVNAAKFLLDRGADVTIGEKDGYTPMHGAGYQGRAPLVKLLASKGVPVDEAHADGYTPIQRACWGREKRHSKAVSAFLDAGAKLDNAASCRTTNKHTKRLLYAAGIPGATPPSEEAKAERASL